MTTDKTTEQFDEAYAANQRRRGPLRAAVRSFYLRNILRRVRGAAVDLGCGSGALLSRLPAGSLGLEVNRAAVDSCVRCGLNARLYDPDEDRYELRDLEAGVYGTLLMVHVLEHLPEPGEALEKIAVSCVRLGIRRIIAVVPGPRGFRHDPTHRVFLDRAFFEARGSIGDFRLAHREHFPLNFSWAGKVFTHNELVVIYDRIA